MDPAQDKIYKYMILLVRKNKKYDFDRLKDNKFVENEKELLKIGLEIFENFNLSNININLFVDVCSAPGLYSSILLNKYPKTQGIGITLPVDEGGVEFIIDDKRFKKVYKNILDKKYRLELPKKIDFGMGSCVSYIVYKDKSMHNLNIELIIKSLYLLLPNLNKGGSIIINMTMSNIYIAFNIISFFMDNFERIKIWKSKTVWETKNTFYLFGYGFNGNQNINIDINNIYDKIKNSKDDIYKKYIGSSKHYEYINKLMRNIYYIRINSWKKK